MPPVLFLCATAERWNIEVDSGIARSANPMTDAGQQRYRVIQRLATGGMAEVFLAESAGIEGFKKRVAIKRVLPHLSKKERFIAMFLDEARLSAHLSHSAVAQVFDIGVGDNAFFIVMEYVDGADLRSVMEYQKRQGQRFPIEAAGFIAAKICEGLSYAHELRAADGQPLHVVHRDMSPPNVLITKYGEIKIVDFGLAKASSQLEKSEAGIIKGKYGYLSPEAALGLEVDHRTDIFAVGIILWEMLAGRRLFIGESDYATVKLVQEAVVPPIRSLYPEVPAELQAIMSRALAKDPAERYESARDLGQDLVRFLFHWGHPVSAHDIALMVQGTAAEKRQDTSEKTNLIDKLIEEALFEFTSLQQTDGERSSDVSEPLRLSGLVDIGQWADELNTGGVPSSRQGPVEGDLAALIETETARTPGSGVPPSGVHPAPRPPTVPPRPSVSPFVAKPPSHAPTAPPQTQQPPQKLPWMFFLAAMIMAVVVATLLARR